MKEDEDIVFEASDEEGTALGAAESLKKLREKIKVLEKEKAEYLDGWQRARADYSNLVKVSGEEKNRLRSMIEETLIEELLPVIDSFGMAFNNKEAWEAVDPNWRSGVEYIHKQLMNILEGHSLHAFGIVGEHFDPSLHQAVSETETNDPEKDHVIAQVLQQGFMVRDSVLRPARVAVYVLKTQ